MVYWDVRPSANFPTVEVRVADVPATIAETVLFATLVRALVMTVIDDEARGAPMPFIRAHALKAEYWKAARYGLESEQAAQSLDSLVEHVRPALRRLGDHDMVRAEVARVLSEGNGAARQRRAWARRHEVADVIDEAAIATVAGV
jgi:carboxylate-amine ligase